LVEFGVAISEFRAPELHLAHINTIHAASLTDHDRYLPLLPKIPEAPAKAPTKASRLDEICALIRTLDKATLQQVATEVDRIQKSK
jgi:hypothetical protein